MLKTRSGVSKTCMYMLFVSFILLSGVLLSSNTHADNITASIKVNPTLTLSIPTNTISLDLDPASTAFASQDLLISVGTNNETGYWLTMSSTTTDLVNTEDNTKTIPTLTSSTTLSDFPVNKWGYKKDSGNYLPFETNTTLLSSDSPVNNDTTTLNFASKIDYKQPAGTYNISLDFKALPNVTTNYIQNLDPTLCTEDPMVVVDSRDEQTYIVQRLKDGKCWMMTNLNLGATSLSAAQLDSTNTNFTGSNASKVISKATFTSWETAAGAEGDSFTVPQYTPVTAQNSATGSDIDPVSKNHYGTIYNFCVASGQTICVDSNSSNATSDICPAGWRLPAGGANGSSSNEFQTLYNYYNSYDKMRAPVSEGGAAFALAGCFTPGVFGSQGTNGLYWSSTRSSSSSPTAAMHSLHITAANENVRLDHFGNRFYGYPIRCVLK